MSGSHDPLGLIDRLAGVTMWSRGGERAPHKPLLLLLALARVQRGDARLVAFAALEEDLARLLADFGPPRRSLHPEYPFWRLQNDGDFWVVPEREALVAARGERKRTGDVPRRLLRERGAHGGFSPEVDAALRGDPALVNQIGLALLEANFPPSLHADILDAVGMPWVVEPRRARRDPGFREAVLRAYERRCAVCDYDLRIGHSDLGIEAAHVKWHAAGGPDRVDNGLALCTFHHKAFDRGALGLDDERRVLVSQDVHGSHGLEEWLVRHVGRPLRLPQPGTDPPSDGFVRWHQRQVFRGPARVAV